MCRKIDLKTPQVLEQPKHPKKIIRQEPVDSSSDLTSYTNDLTESTQYTSENVSSSTQNTTKSEQLDEEDSYFSDGAWLLSKSEGQIIPNANNGKIIKSFKVLSNYSVKICLNLLAYVKTSSKTVVTRRFSNQSDGELKLDPAGLEKGEIPRALNHMEPQSDGELKTLLHAENNSIETLKIAAKSKKSKVFNRKLDKTIVNLSISPQKSSKNNIQIQSIRNLIFILY